MLIHSHTISANLNLLFQFHTVESFETLWLVLLCFLFTTQSYQMFTRVTKQDNILNAPSTLIFVINIQSMTHNPFIDANTFCLVAVLSLYLWTAGQAVGGGRSSA